MLGLETVTGGMSNCVNTYGIYGGQFPCTSEFLELEREREVSVIQEI